jgi:hypothetical protein
MGAGDALFKTTVGFLGIATVLTGGYLTASMVGAYLSASSVKEKVSPAFPVALVLGLIFRDTAYLHFRPPYDQELISEDSLQSGQRAAGEQAG